MCYVKISSYFVRPAVKKNEFAIMKYFLQSETSFLTAGTLIIIDFR